MKNLKIFTGIVFLFLTGFRSPLVNAQDTITDEQILVLYAELRVADVCDGMDMVGLRDAGTMDASIEPLWRDVENLSARTWTESPTQAMRGVFEGRTRELDEYVHAHDFKRRER